LTAGELAYRLGTAARSPASWWQLLKFGLVGGSGYVINLAVLEALLASTSLGDLSAQAIAVAVAMPFNFLGNKLWAFA
jgi:putative flippase GtrA